MSSRRERARRIAFAVSERVAEASTPGLGHWDLTWELVAEPSDRFLDALYEWERSGERDDLDTVQSEAETLVLAWQTADAKFQVSQLQDAPEAVVSTQVRT